MFIRWKKQKDRKYGYIEERHYKEGKVVSKVIAYLGTIENAKGKLIELLNEEAITEGQFNNFSTGLPEPDKRESKSKTIVPNKKDIATMQKVISEQEKEIKHLINRVQQLEHERIVIRQEALEENGQEVLKLKNKVAGLEKELQTLNNSNTNLPKELTRAEVEDIWQNDGTRVKYHPDVQQKARQSLFKGLFSDDGDKTSLFNSDFKVRPYVCPFTNKKFGIAGNLVKSAIPLLVKQKYQISNNKPD